MGEIHLISYHGMLYAANMRGDWIVAKRLALNFSNYTANNLCIFRLFQLVGVIHGSITSAHDGFTLTYNGWGSKWLTRDEKDFAVFLVWLTTSSLCIEYRPCCNWRTKKSLGLVCYLFSLIGRSAVVFFRKRSEFFLVGFTASNLY